MLVIYVRLNHSCPCVCDSRCTRTSVQSLMMLSHFSNYVVFQWKRLPPSTCDASKQRCNTRYMCSLL